MTDKEKAAIWWILVALVLLYGAWLWFESACKKERDYIAACEVFEREVEVSGAPEHGIHAGYSIPVLMWGIDWRQSCPEHWKRAVIRAGGEVY